MPTTILATPPLRARTITAKTKNKTNTTTITTTLKIPLHQIHHPINLKMNQPINELQNGKRDNHSCMEFDVVLKILL